MNFLTHQPARRLEFLDLSQVGVTASQKKSKGKERKEKQKRSKRIECHKAWRKRIDTLTSGEALRRMLNTASGENVIAGGGI